MIRSLFLFESLNQASISMVYRCQFRGWLDDRQSFPSFTIMPTVFLIVIVTFSAAGFLAPM